MEEDTVELYDYFSLIWKRKIFIIALTLVGIVVGVVATVVKSSSSKMTPATSYSASIVIRVGDMVNLRISTVALEPVEQPIELVELIPIRYEEILSESPGYHLDVKVIAQTNMLKLTLRGPDRGVERVLKELVDMLIAKHYSKSKDSFASYRSIIEKLEEDAKVLQENIILIESSIEKMKNKERQIMEYLHTSEGKVGADKSLGDRYAIWDMLYIKTIDKTLELNKIQKKLRNQRWQIAAHRATLGDTNNYNTRMIGKMKSTTVVEPQKNQYFIMKAGFAGLIMSLFIAFFIEYIEQSKSKSKRKGK